MPHPSKRCPECGAFDENCYCGEYEDDDAECTHCNGEGLCWNGCDPLWYDDVHACHACHGTGNRRDQVIF